MTGDPALFRSQAGHTSGPLKFFPPEYRPALALAIFQLLIVITLAVVNTGLWPTDDDVTYLDQGLTLRLGGFPSAPTRPVFYPWLLSLGMRLFGLRLELVALLQGLFLPITTVLLYHFARRRLHRPFALLAVFLFGLWPGVIFYSFRFYREFMAGFMLVVVFVLIDRMRDQPKAYLRAALTGVAAGMMVMLRPEFGLLLALWALADAIDGLRRRRLFSASAPWVIAGILALATIFPAALAARAAFGEWVFISTYTGVTYTWSFCGELPDDERSFWARDRERTVPINAQANRIIYFSDPSVPFGRRDAELWKIAKRCVARDPGQALTLVTNRAPLTWFQLSAVAADMIKRGAAGNYWPAWSVQSLHLWEFLVQFTAVIFIGPGFLRLWQKQDSRLVALSLPWFMLYYATVFFVYRYRVSVLPVLALAAAAGAEGTWKAWLERDRRALGRGAILIVGAVMVCLAVSSPWNAAFTRRGSWLKVTIQPAMTEARYKIFTTMLAEDYIRLGRYDLMRRELPVFIRSRRDTLSPELLAEAASDALKKFNPTAARLFAAEVLRQTPDHGPAVEIVRTLDDSLRTVQLVDWTRAGTGGGIAIYSTDPSSPLALNTKLPPEELRLEIGGRGKCPMLL